MLEHSEALPPGAAARETFFVRALQLGLGAALLHATYVLLLGLWQPLLDLHSFRQTQTALSAYWLLHGGPLLAYETPILGAPWAIPFEFPLYQWSVAILAFVGVPLDAAGRLISFGFYIATLWPLAMLFRTFGLGRVAFLASAILFLTSPLYLYWSRTFLVESCALFFSVLALAWLAEYLRRRTIAAAVGAMLAGCAATLSKATTFPAFAFVAGLLVLFDLGQRFLIHRRLAELRSVIVPALILGIPLGVGYGWVAYSDYIKGANEFGKHLTAAGLTNWNFGSLSQRLSGSLWDATISKRVLWDLFGFAVPVAFLSAGATMPRLRQGTAVSLALTGFLVPFLVFTNLHIIHNYYQYANGVFALAAVGIGVGSVTLSCRRTHFVLAAALLTTLAVGQITYFNSHFKPLIVQDYASNPLLRAAIAVRNNTPETSSVLVLGDDWASTVPYYAQRKGLALPGWAPAPLVERVLGDPQSFLGDRALGAIVLCDAHMHIYQHRARLEALTARLPLLGDFQGCRAFRGAP